MILDFPITSVPSGSDDKESSCNVGDRGSVPRLGRSPGEEKGNLLQYSCLGKSHGQRSLAGYRVWGHKESDTTEQQTLSHKLHWVSSSSFLHLFWKILFFFFKMFFMWTIFKVFTEFGTILFPLYVLVFWPRGMWDLSSPASNQTRSPCFGGQSLIPWTTSEVPVILH